MYKIASVIAVLFFVCLGSPLSARNDAAESGRIFLQDRPYIAAVRIDIRDASPGLEEDLTGVARDLISLEPGRLLSDISLIQAIDALKASRRFEHVDVRSARDEDGIELIFTLKPYRLIEGIRIFGKFPLFEKDVMRVMNLYIGGVFTTESLAVQERRIADLYRREGFIEPEVRIEVQQGKTRHAAELRVYIDKGPFYHIKEVRIDGNRAFSDIRLKSKMSLWISSFLPGSAGRLVEKELKDDVNNVVRYYRSKGYPECRVKYTIERDSADKTAVVVFSVDEGPEYTVVFSGNEEFWNYTLRKDLVVFHEGNANDRGLRRSINNIRKRYIDAGFADVHIDVRDERTQIRDSEQRTVYLTIREGVAARVTALSFEGNHAIGSNELRKQVYLDEGTVYTAQALEDDLFSLKTFYLASGFGDAVVDHEELWNRDRSGVSVVFRISEGVRTMITSVRMTGMRAMGEGEAYQALTLREGTPLRKYLLRSDENALAARISERGYPYVTVGAQVIPDEGGSEAEVVYTVDEGPLVTMGNIYYQGNFRTDEKVLNREIEMSRGDPFSLKKMLEGQRNIRDMAIFSSVQFNTVGLKEKREEITLLADMEERKPYYFQIGGGYESERGLFAQTRAGDHNLFGANKDAWAAGEVSQIGYKTEMGLKEPRLFTSRVSATLGLFSEKRQEFNQNFGTRMYGATLVLGRTMTRSITAGLGFRYEFREGYLLDDPIEPADPVDEETLIPRGILVTTPSVVYDTRDSFIKPTRGVYSSLSIDISKGVRKSLDNFFKYRLDARYYVTPIDRITLAWLGRVGYLDPFGPSDQVPDDQLFFLGGTLDVRGFDENMLRFDENGDPLGGRFSLAGSVEARIDFWRNLELTCFYDIGTVRDTYEDIGSDDFRSSAGLGLRFLTPIGPIGILYGHKLDRKPGESPGRFHFSVGYTF